MSRLTDKARQWFYPLVRAGLKRGLDPAWVRYESVLEETVPEYFQRYASDGGAGTYVTLGEEETAANALPCNVPDRDRLPKERGWWGYSFWDVPSRTSGETFVATLPECLVVPKIDAETDEFWVAILNRDRRALRMREIVFRDRHASVLRSSAEPVRVDRATWVLERVYHNHSHWLTAHLPKFVLLKERGELDDVLLPARRTRVMDSSLRMIGLDPERFPTFDMDRPLQVDELTVLGTDRFRPELLRPVREAVARSGEAEPYRKIYISRARAPRRRLINEDEIWPVLNEAGFERVFMEDLPFSDQVALMQETAVVVAPHGAGLTNVMFCASGTHVVEIADLSFPNPNFYAVASAMDLNYWLVSADGVGAGHPLERDMQVGRSTLVDVLSELPL